jgi:hypothetical protein
MTCDNCKHRSEWRTDRLWVVMVCTSAECLAPNLPGFWRVRKERPLVMPGWGSECKLFEAVESASGATASITQVTPL